VTEHARAVGASVVVKGLRAISDFDYEFQMAQINRHLAAEIETVYLPASPQYSFISSSGVREVATWGGDVEDWVPAQVALALRERLRPAAGTD
jgi:pantetheine-phosphate adenylyltransferase